jgi:hypothetical protein
MDIVERIIAYRDRPGRSRHGRDLLADAANEIDRLRRDNEMLRREFGVVKEVRLRNLPALGVENNRQQDSGSSQGKQGSPPDEG